MRLAFAVEPSAVFEEIIVCSILRIYLVIMNTAFDRLCVFQGLKSVAWYHANYKILSGRHLIRTKKKQVYCALRDENINF